MQRYKYKCYGLKVKPNSENTTRNQLMKFYNFVWKIIMKY